MKKELRYTLLPDGTSDRALIPIINWLLIEQGINIPIQADWAKLGLFKKPPKSLEERIIITLELYPSDILFIHRDAEKEPRQNRINEIKKALIAQKISIPYLCVIPVRMLESWLLFDEIAIRKAAENPHGKQVINLPSLKDIENISEPKKLLCNLLRQASGYQGRKLKKFQSRERQKIIDIPNFINDFSTLRKLSAFQSLEAELKLVLIQNNWIN